MARTITLPERQLLAALETAYRRGRGDGARQILTAPNAPSPNTITRVARMVARSIVTELPSPVLPFTRTGGHHRGD